MISKSTYYLTIILLLMLLLNIIDIDKLLSIIQQKLHNLRNVFFLHINRNSGPTLERNIPFYLIRRNKFSYLFSTADAGVRFPRRHGRPHIFRCRKWLRRRRRGRRMHANLRAWFR